MSDSTPPISSTYELVHPVEVYVVTPTRHRAWINVVLLLLTIFTTLMVGVHLEDSFLNNQPSLPENLLGIFPVQWAFAHPSRLLLGVPFCATLMLILLAHEMGHYLYCRRYGVYASLPYFIPAPTLIGTLGAFIRIKSPIRSRAALFDIGIAGPIAGFTLALVTLFFSLMLSKPLTAPLTPQDNLFGCPAIFYAVHWLVAHLGICRAGSLPLDQVYLHPMAIAAWVGMFATALNLLPGGQLDGGHILYAVFPRAHRAVSNLTMVLLLVASWWWVGWLIWAVLLNMSGNHPPVPKQPPLPANRRKLFLVAVALLALTFMLAPLKEGGMAGFWEQLQPKLHKIFYVGPKS
jgi:membrane-associated protease RseP (regulator of RpoE activity)